MNAMDQTAAHPEPPEHADRIPPGQALTRRFPVVGERLPPVEALDLDAWRLEVAGAVQRPLSLTYAEVLALPGGERVVDIHCVTGWTHLGMRLQGVPLARVLELAAPASDARFVRFVAWSPRAHDTSLPLALARADTWLVHAADGAPLAPEHGFPLRCVTPSRYFYKSLKWVRRIELLVADQLGYWERASSYHPVGDPWPGDQRFTSGSLDQRRVLQLRNASDLGPWRDARKLVLSADLRDWRPLDRDLRGVQLKHCDLRGADLERVDLRAANLSLSDLRGATLRDADLRGADLEGANFAGADLSRADLRDTALSATRFFETDSEGARHAAVVDAIRLQGARGLLEDQETFLRERASGT